MSTIPWAVKLGGTMEVSNCDFFSGSTSLTNLTRRTTHKKRIRRDAEVDLFRGRLQFLQVPVQLSSGKLLWMDDGKVLDGDECVSGCVFRSGLRWVWKTLAELVGNKFPKT